MLRILHTSDWHLGRSLYGKSRYNEFEAFLNWLAELITQEHIDVLLISGDVFDTTTPSNKAQELYYFFLARIAKTDCRKVIVIAGNHDSPTFLDASKAILKALDVEVIGYAGSEPESEIIAVRDNNNNVELVVCAVPYLRERDIRIIDSSESLDDRALRVKNGIIEHYQKISSMAEKVAAGAPVVALGHLFTAGGKAEEGTGVRELYVGTLAHVNAGDLPVNIAYYALGHLHMQQRVGGKDNIRYCGAPLAMGFAEAEQTKYVLQLDFTDNNPEPQITEIAVPVFQQLKRISGNLNEILLQLELLKSQGDSVWVEIEYTGEEFISDLHARIESAIEGTTIEARRIRNNSIFEISLQQLEEGQEMELAELSDLDIFQKRLDDSGEISAEVREELTRMYKEIRTGILEEDKNAL